MNVGGTVSFLTYVSAIGLVSFSCFNSGYHFWVFHITRKYFTCPFLEKIVTHFSLNMISSYNSRLRTYSWFITCRSLQKFLAELEPDFLLSLLLAYLGYLLIY